MERRVTLERHRPSFVSSSSRRLVGFFLVSFWLLVVVAVTFVSFFT